MGQMYVYILRMKTRSLNELNNGQMRLMFGDGFLRTRDSEVDKQFNLRQIMCLFVCCPDRWAFKSRPLREVRLRRRMWLGWTSHSTKRICPRHWRSRKRNICCRWNVVIWLMFDGNYIGKCISFSFLTHLNNISLISVEFCSGRIVANISTSTASIHWVVDR